MNASTARWTFLDSILVQALDLEEFVRYASTSLPCWAPPSCCNGCLARCAEPLIHPSKLYACTGAAHPGKIKVQKISMPCQGLVACIQASLWSSGLNAAIPAS